MGCVLGGARTACEGVMSGHRVEAIANQFIKRARRDGKALTNMQLQKLPYIAHGWGLVINKAHLINVEARAWPYGPVYPELYNSLKKYGSSNVTDFIHENEGNPFVEDVGPVIEEKLDPSEEKLLDAVWNAYKDHHAYQLSALTHQPDSPWTITTNTYGAYTPISNDLMRRHFLELTEKRKRPIG